MIKKEFIKEVADRTGFTQVDVSSIVESGIDVITEHVCDNDYVLFAGFGRFEAAHRGAKKIRDFFGRTVYSRDTYVPMFRPGKTFKDAVEKAFGATYGRH